jgi:hypothetical protein
MAPAPKNHTHDTTWAAILPGSLTDDSYIIGNIIDITINRQDHTQISICVLIHAG